MSKKRCKFCHEYIDDADYDAHCEEHRQIQPDGQQAAYPTLPEEERYQGSLDDIPQVYVHGVCGAATGMPEDIIRSYLVDPYMYLSDKTFCHGCSDHVPMRECTWDETGENVQVYIDKLRALHPEKRPGCIVRLIVAILKAGG